jgi:hypothetical protein
MRVPFLQVFQLNPDGSVTPRVSVHVGRAILEPGTSFPPRGVAFGGGFDFAVLVGHDLEIQQSGSTVTVFGYY